MRTAAVLPVTFACPTARGTYGRRCRRRRARGQRLIGADERPEVTRGHGPVVDSGRGRQPGELCRERSRDIARRERLDRGALTVGRRRAELVGHLHRRALRIHGGAERRRRIGDAAGHARHRCIRLVGVGEQPERARPVGEQEERRPHRSTLARLTVAVERGGDAGGRDRLPHVGLAGSVAGRRQRNVALIEHERRVGGVHEVTRESHRARRRLLTPRHIRRVAGERDVRASRVDARGRDRVAAVHDLEVRRRSRDEPRHEHLLVSAHRLGPRDPWSGRIGRVHRSGGDARILGVGPQSAVQRARLLGRRARGAAGGRVQDPVPGVPDHVPVKATEHAGAGVALGLGREHQVVLSEPAGAGLVPDDPRHRVVRAGEGDVRLDPVAVDVDVQARVRVALTRALDAHVLEAEAADRGDVPSTRRPRRPA